MNWQLKLDINGVGLYSNAGFGTNYTWLLIKFPPSKGGRERERVYYVDVNIYRWLDANLLYIRLYVYIYVHPSGTTYNSTTDSL